MADGAPVAGRTEAGIYEALGLDMIPPELREGRGEIEAAELHALADLIQHGDIRGDIHSHTTATDGREDVEAMALYANNFAIVAVPAMSKPLSSK